MAGAGDGVAVVALDPGEGGVAEPVGGDLLGGDPGEVLADSGPEVVVTAGGDGAPVAVAEKLIGRGPASLLDRATNTAAAQVGPVATTAVGLVRQHSVRSGARAATRRSSDADTAQHHLKLG